MVTLHVAIAVPTPLSLIAAVAFTAPLFASIGAVTLLREPLLASRAGAVLVGFAGALIVLRPGTSAFSLGALWVVVHAACWAGALVTTKRMARTEAPAVTVAYTMLMLTLCTLPLALSAWTWPTLAALGWMALVGLLQVSNQLALTQAMRETDATVVMPFDFLRLVWASIYGYMVYAEQPHLATWAGGTVIFAAATMLTLVETRGRAPARSQLGSRS